MKIFSFEKSVGAVIYRKKDGTNLYLLLKYQNGHWSFPKGHLEVNETNEETLRREVKEETGLGDLKIIPNFSEKEKYFYIAGTEERKWRQTAGKGIYIFKKVYYYLAETNESNVRISGEHNDFIWLGYDEALAKVTYKNSKRILRKANDYLLSL